MSIKQSITPQDVCDLLNDFIHLDLKCATKLLNTRVSCNSEIASHEAIQVSDIDSDPQVGIIGILNGMFGVRSDGTGIITLETSDDGIPIVALVSL